MLLMPVAQRYNSFAAAQRLDLSLGNLHFGVAAWLCRVHRGSNAAEMQTHYRPLRVRKHQNGNLAASQVLLILDILVCREQYLEAGRLRGVQVATGIRVPRKTHAPLRLPGTLSTTGHCDQSSAAIANLLLLF